MLLTVDNEDHANYRVFDKDGKQVGLLQEYDTITCKGKQVHCKDGKILVDENNEIIVDEIVIEGGYALDPQGNKVK